MKLTSLFRFLLLTQILVLLSSCSSKPTPTPILTTAEPISTQTKAPDPSPEPSLTPTATETPIQEEPLYPTPSATLIPAPDYPESHFIQYVHGHKQIYELGCEASAAVDWANFFGVSIYEYSLQTSLPLSDNPDFGYVGEVTTDAWGQIPPYAYGVHAEPIAEALRAYQLPAKAVRNYSIEEVKQKLSENKPIIVWVIGNLVYSDPVEYVDQQGRVAIVAPYEHVVILTGYNQTHIRYMNNGKFYDAPTEVFLTSWRVLGYMAVIHE